MGLQFNLVGSLFRIWRFFLIMLFRFGAVLLNVVINGILFSERVLSFFRYWRYLLSCLSLFFLIWPAFRFSFLVSTGSLVVSCVESCWRLAAPLVCSLFFSGC